jgi:hypothetical protein
VGKLLITSRDLCVCIASGDVCPTVTRSASSFNRPWVEKGPLIVDERDIRVPATVLTASAKKQSRAPATKELTRRIQGALVASRSQNRRPTTGAIRFLDTDTFAGRIRRVLPEDRLKEPVPLDGLSSTPRREPAAEPLSAGEVLGTRLRDLPRRLGVSEQDAVTLRRRALGRPAASAAAAAPGAKPGEAPPAEAPPAEPGVTPRAPGTRPRRGGGGRGRRS